MIKISHKNIETPIELKEGSPLILSVENQREFYKFVSDLNRAFSEGESGGKRRRIFRFLSNTKQCRFLLEFFADWA